MAAKNPETGKALTTCQMPSEGVRSGPPPSMPCGSTVRAAPRFSRVKERLAVAAPVPERSLCTVTIARAGPCAPQPRPKRARQRRRPRGKAASSRLRGAEMLYRA